MLRALLFTVVGVAMAGASYSNPERVYNGDVRRGGVEPRHLQEPGILPECPAITEPEGGIPDHFDARNYWKYCPSLWEIRDQGYCLSCWAVAIASVLTDRYCIASNGTKNFRFSDQDLLACSKGYQTGWSFKRCSGKGVCLTQSLQGCEGGSVERAWRYLTNSTQGRNGLVSGGAYKSQHGCLQYGYKPCNHTDGICNVVDVNGNPPKESTCVKNCQDTYKLSFAQDKHGVASACQFHFPGSNSPEFPNFIKQVQMEIMTHGPVVAVMDLYESFDKLDPQNENYIYDIDDNDEPARANHAVKIIGWGNQDGKDYWLVSNSYNYYWGHRGFYKIFRGSDGIRSARINTQISTGHPRP